MHCGVVWVQCTVGTLLRTAYLEAIDVYHHVATRQLIVENYEITRATKRACVNCSARG